MGVPQNPQEYRLIVKVAERESRVERPKTVDVPVEQGSDADLKGKPKREKAPAAPRIGAEGSSSESTSSRKRRRRRRRGKGGGGRNPSAGFR
jgi:hypothetical protein